MLKIYTDGSCSKNGYEGSNGSFGVIVVTENDICVYAYSSPRVDNTTNNREEIKAILYAIKNFGSTDDDIAIYSDSSYAVNMFNQWFYSWRAKGWLKSDNKPPENLDLIYEYNELLKLNYKFSLNYVPGHAGNYWNELADKLATLSVKPDDILGIDRNKKV